MKHCHISIMSNELIFLKQKLQFLYDNFEQIIFIDYDILNTCNSKDGSIDYIQNFDDKDNKITLIKFNENDLKSITNYNGVSMVEKRKMFAKGSNYINDDIDIVWATDMDEFFDKKLISMVEDEFKQDSNLITLDFPEYTFVYNQYNIFKGKEINNSSYICPPRITRHSKNKIYGHCNFQDYGKTKKCEKEFIYHFAWIGYNRTNFKLKIYNRNNDSIKKKINDKFLNMYYKSLIKKEKYINISHPNLDLKMCSVKFDNKIPEYIDNLKMVNELNKLN